MSLFFSLLPLYLFGNLHCLGMCGPLVLVIGSYRYKLWYFLGRVISFSIAGFFSGFFGSVVNGYFQIYHISVMTSFFFGGILALLGLAQIFGIGIYPEKAFLKPIEKVKVAISKLMLKDQSRSIFLFGFLTICLPCGQTLLVFSACALANDPTIGAFNGFCFALLTSPSLFFAMRARPLFQKARKYGDLLIGLSAILAGVFSLCRGLAGLEIISHLVINSGMDPKYHLVLY